MSLSTEVVRAIASFIPSNTAYELTQGQSFAPGQERRNLGVAMFVDIAGFTPMAEQLVSLMRDTQNGAGYRGAEELNRIINRTFTAIIRPIHANGGIVTRFGGDALFAYFPDPNPELPQETINCALTCATEMQAAMKPLSLMVVEGRSFPISIKIGLSYGEAITILLGKRGYFQEIVLAGPALDQATEAEHHASRGDTILAPSLLSRLAVPDATPLDHGFARLNQPPDSACQAQAILNPIADLPPEQYQSYVERLRSYLPQSILRQLLATQGELPGDYRRITNLFLVFEGIDYTEPGVGQKLQAYVLWAYETVTRFGGTLLRVTSGDKGSGLHVTFGAPDKHDDDIERALRCALALRDDPNRPAYIVGQRIGIASGLVFAASIGAPERREYTVIGDEINLSARLMMATASETILVDDYTQERAAYRFKFEPLPPLTLKGKAQPVQAHQLSSERTPENTLEARFNARWPLVGREQDVADLKKIANRAYAGQGQIISLSGLEGVGKTRLMQEVVHDWLSRSSAGVLGQCNQHLRNAPYHPWIGFWHNFFQLELQEDPETWRAKIAATAAAIAPETVEWLDVLGDILGLPIPKDSPVQGLDAERRRQQLHHVSLTLLQGRANQQPLLIVFEDLHWVDEVSADLIDYIAPRIRHQPILLCLLFRSTHAVPVEAIALSHCTWRTIEELGPAQMEPLMQAMLGQAIIPPPVARAMYDKTHGNPHYVEEIIEHLTSSEILDYDGQTYIFRSQSQLTDIPDTLQDLVKARLDRLEAATRDLAQVAAVIDREFFYNLLKTIYPYPISSQEMRDRLDSLVFSDITTITQAGTNPGYFFKNALSYEVAYDSLAFARRRLLHRRTAEAIEQIYQTNLDEHFGSLVYHYRNAQAYDKALKYNIEAGRRAQRLYANAAAMQDYNQAETYLAKISLDDHWPLVTQLYLNRCQLHRLNGDFPAALADVDRGLNLAETYGDTCSQAQGHNLKAELAFYQEQRDLLQQEAETAYRLAQAGQHPQEEATALYHLGVADMLAGTFDQSQDSLQRAYTMAQTNDQDALASEALNKLAMVSFFDGDLAQALTAFRTVYETRHKLGLKDKEAEALSNIANLEFRLNRPLDAMKTARQSIQVAQEAGWQLMIPYLKLLQVEILGYLGHYDQAETLTREAYALFDAKDVIGHAYAQLTQAREILLDLSQTDQAARLLDQSWEVMSQHGIFEEMARALVSLGTVSARKKAWAEAQAFYQEAQTICLERHKGWYLSEIYVRLAEAFLQQDQFDEALAAIEAGQQAIADRSNPDWQGSLLFLKADIQLKLGQALEDVTELYIMAVRHSRARSRAIERNRLLIHIGTQLLPHTDPKIRQGAEKLIQQGMAWLEARSEGALHNL